MLLQRFRHFGKSVAAFAVRPGQGSKTAILRSYVQLTLADWLGSSPGSARVLGASFRFPDAFGMRYIFEEIVIGRHYAVRPPLRSDAVIVDAGANIGLATLYFKRLFPSARVIAIEPHPRTLEYLRTNIRNGQVTGVTIHEAALAAHPGKRRIAGENIGAALSDDDDGIVVDAIALNSVVHRGAPIDILKLDIEGSELEVLRAIRFDLARIDQIVAEVHKWEGQCDPLPEILSLLDQGGHRYELLHWTSSSEPTTCILRSWRRAAGSYPLSPIAL